MQQLVSGAQRLVRRLRSGSRGEEAAEKFDVQPTKATASNLEPESALGGLQASEADVQRIGGERKRGRGDEEAGPEQKRMKQTTSGKTSSLLPNYVAPADSQPIEFVRPGREAARSIRETSTRAKVGAGAYKPRNTLNEGRYDSKTSGGLYGGMNGNTVIGKMGRPVLKTEGVRGTNVPSDKDILGDGFTNDFKQAPKRQKLANGVSSPQRQNGHIDLTEDDSQLEHSYLARGRSSDRHANVDPARSAIAGVNDPSVASRIDKYTRPETEKKKRKARNSQGSSQNSVPGTPDDSMHVLGRNQSAPKQQQTRSGVDDVIEDIDDDVRVMPPPPNVSNTRSRTTATNGAHNRQPRKSHPGSSADIIGSTDLMRSKLQQHAALDRQRKRYDSKQAAAPTSVQRKSLQQSASPKVFPSPPERKTDRLRDEFQPIRDAPDDKSGPQRRLAMQAFSDHSGNRRSLDSEDELASARTVPRSISRSISPQKGQRQTVQETKTLHGTAKQRGHSPSSIKPAIFYSSSQSTSKRQSGRQQTAQTANSNQPDERYRIPVKSILCRSCCLSQPDIELVMNSEASGFFVKCNGEYQRVPNRDQLVEISGKGASKWYEADTEEVLTVQIKTTVSVNSNGNVLIEFYDSEGRFRCYNRLLSGSNESMEAKNERDERMTRIAVKMSVYIREDFEKESRVTRTMSRSKPASADSELALIKKNQDQRRRKIEQPSDDEEIQYEPKEPLTHRSMRSQMQAGTRSSTDSAHVLSPYFSERSERRTSRQLKPVKQKSPTPPPPPPRWSHLNNLGTWSHSVIYPPEGAVRRVTVDSQDIERLDEGEFLNDNLISFALRRIEESMAPEQKEKVLYFNSFFYTALTNKNGRRAFNYDAVKRWTKNKDLLSIPYIVVPINIDLHWFVAIICNLPNLSRKFEDSDSDSEGENEVVEQPQLTKVSEVADDEHATTTTQKSLLNLSLSDEDMVLDTTEQVDLIEDSIEVSSSRPSTARGRKPKKKAPPRQRTFDPDAPCIITLDSFGSAHTAETRNLKDYVVAEAQEKRSIQLTKDDLQGVTAKGLPEQKNFCDCGLYLVGYIEEFAKDPRRFITKLLSKKEDVAKDFENFDPSLKREEIRNELLALHEQQDAARKATKSAKKSTAPVNGEIPKAQNSAIDSKAQSTEQKKASKMEGTTSFVPLLPTAVDQFDGTTNPGHRIVESDELETEVPRALADEAPLPIANEDTASPGLPVEATNDEEDEISWGGFGSDHGLEPPNGGANEKMVSDSIFDHGLEHYMPSQIGQSYIQLAQPSEHRQTRQYGGTSKDDSEDFGEHSKQMRKENELINRAFDLDDEHDLEVQDSQEKQVRLFETEVS